MAYDDINYTAGEQARRVALGVRGTIRLLRGGPIGRIDDRLDRIEDEARQRTDAERAARDAKAARDRADRAARKYR